MKKFLLCQFKQGIAGKLIYWVRSNLKKGSYDCSVEVIVVSVYLALNTFS